MYLLIIDFCKNFNRSINNNFKEFMEYIFWSTRHKEDNFLLCMTILVFEFSPLTAHLNPFHIVVKLLTPKLPEMLCFTLPYKIVNLFADQNLSHTWEKLSILVKASIIILLRQPQKTLFGYGMLNIFCRSPGSFKTNISQKCLWNAHKLH